VRVYRGADGDFTLYDDDGKTYAEGGDQKIPACTGTTLGKDAPHRFGVP